MTALELLRIMASWEWLPIEAQEQIREALAAAEANQ